MTPFTSVGRATANKCPCALLVLCGASWFILCGKGVPAPLAVVGSTFQQMLHHAHTAHIIIIIIRA